MTKTTNERIAKAETALKVCDDKLAELAERERETARAFASAPSDANADKLRVARTRLDDWKRGREYAALNLQDARDDAFNEEIKAHRERSQAEMKRASRAAFRSAIAPHVTEIVKLVKAIDQRFDSCERVLADQRRAAQEAKEHGGLAGVPVDPPLLEYGDITAEVLFALHKQTTRPLEWMLARFADDASLANRVINLTRAGERAHHGAGAPPFLEQAQAALNGDMSAIYAAINAAAE